MLVLILFESSLSFNCLSFNSFKNWDWDFWSAK